MILFFKVLTGAMRLGHKFRDDQIIPINSEIPINYQKAIINLFNLGKIPNISIEFFQKKFKHVDRLINVNTIYNLTEFVELCSGRSIFNWLAYHNQFAILKFLMNDRIIQDYHEIQEFDNLLEDFSLPVNVYELFVPPKYFTANIKNYIVGRYRLALTMCVKEHCDYLTSFVKKYDLLTYKPPSHFKIKWHLGMDSLTLLKMHPPEFIDYDLCYTLIVHLEQKWMNTSIYCQWGLECLNWIVYSLIDSRRYLSKFTSVFTFELKHINNIPCKAIIIKLGENIKTRDTFFKCFARLEWAHGKPYLTDLRNLYDKVQKDEWNSIEPIISQRFRGALLPRIKELWEDNFHLIKQPPITTGAFAEFH